MIKIIFVCHGNICRSPMAEFVFRDMVIKKGLSDIFVISSAATSTEEIGNPVHPGTRNKLLEYGITSDQKKAVQLMKSDYSTFDYIIGMDQRNIINIQRIFNIKDDKKIFRLLDLTGGPRDIADPWYTGNFIETYEDVLEGCKALLTYVLKYD
jgi:protein-tyrosine phosphatase